MTVNVICKNGGVAQLNGDFKKALEFVKGIQGRKWNGVAKAWELTQYTEAEVIKMAVQADVHDLKLQEEVERQQEDEINEWNGDNYIAKFEETLLYGYGKEVSVESKEEREQIRGLWQSGSSGEEIAHAYAVSMGWAKKTKKPIDINEINKLIGKTK